jgi:hypothetical protein
MRMKTAGLYRVVDRDSFAFADVNGSERCKQLATDVVRAVVVGAYELRTKAHALVNFGVGVGGADVVSLKSLSDTGNSQDDGTFEQCDESDGGAARKCDSILNVDLVPISGAPGRNVGDAQRVTGGVVFGVGALGVGAGAIAGALALSNISDAKDACPAHTGCSTSVTTTYGHAVTEANIANVAIGGGLAAMAVGSYIFLSAPRLETETPRTTGELRLSPYVGPQGAGASLSETF